MPSHASSPRPPRPLARDFFPSRLAPATLAQVYERLGPGPRRPVPLPTPRADASPGPPPRHAARI